MFRPISPRRFVAPEFTQRPPAVPSNQSLMGEEERVYPSASPRLALWPELTEFEEHLLRIRQRRTELGMRVQTLSEEINRAELGIKRSTFVIDQDGNVARAMYGVKPEGHADKVLEALPR
jgi:hypothetical protein